MVRAKERVAAASTTCFFFIRYSFLLLSKPEAFASLACLLIRTLYQAKLKGS
jgi:hypothetical protein